MNNVLPTVILVSVCSLVWLFVLFEQLKAARALQARATLLSTLPLRRARGDLPDGDAIVVGRVQPTGATLRSPLHGTDCVYFSFSVREKQTVVAHSSGKAKSKVVWVTRAADTGIAGAVVGEDGVAIDLRFAGGPRVDIKVDARHTTGFLNGPDERLEETLQRYQVPTTGLLFNKDLQIEERVLEPGDTVTLIGAFKTEPDGRTRMMPLLPGAEGDDGLWLITDRKPETLIATARRAVRRATTGLIVWCLSLPVGLVLLAVAFDRWTRT